MIAGRARRTYRRLKRGAGPAGIILTSLIDIFTVLLFFLLLHAANVEVLPEPRDLKLPESASQEKTQKTLVVMVSPKDIWVEAEHVGTVADAMANGRDDIPALQAALARRPLPAPTPEESAAGKPGTRKVTIMGDKAIPYRLLRKVMLSCSQAGFAQVSLAVSRKAG